MINGIGPNPAAMASQAAAVNASQNTDQNRAPGAQQPGSAQANQATPGAQQTQPGQAAAIGANQGGAGPSAQAADNPSAARGIAQVSGTQETNAAGGATAAGAINGPEGGNAVSATDEASSVDGASDNGDARSAELAAREEEQAAENNLAATLMPDGTMDNRGINTAGSTLDIQV
ncbi:hypothetical protein [Thioalkalivibrio sp. ALgr3]|uniref:hypothetical protein n=1 Tax=Thioalkalivibrio sp. ALgr3 TaxID=1239292 RepID=UPI00037133D2|nr:hypothetical protein [Thioalkalivibrio sp. ALgr3]